MSSRPLKVKVNSTYFEKALNKLKALNNDFAKEVDEELAAASVDIEKKAIENAPPDYSRLRGAIKANKVSLLTHRVSVGVNYAAYVEFGTGGEYTKYEPKLPNLWRNIAADFWVSGKGTTRAQPYLYPAYKVVMKDFKKRFKDRLKALLKK